MAVLMALVVTSRADAAISPDVIQACVNEKSGEVHILLEDGKKKAAKCKKKDIQLDWNIQGVPGEPGADSIVPGPKGDTGDDSIVPGPKGDTGDDSIVPGPKGETGADSTVPGPKGDKGDQGLPADPIRTIARVSGFGGSSGDIGDPTTVPVNGNPI